MMLKTDEQFLTSSGLASHDVRFHFSSISSFSLCNGFRLTLFSLLFFIFWGSVGPDNIQGCKAVQNMTDLLKGPKGSWADIDSINIFMGFITIADAQHSGLTLLVCVKPFLSNSVRSIRDPSNWLHFLAVIFWFLVLPNRMILEGWT